MKKYLLGFLAVILAVGFSAFTTPKKALTTRLFLFNITTAGSYGPTQVAAQANWDEFTSENPCVQFDQEIPCSIEVPVDAAYVTSGHPSSIVTIVPSSTGTDRFVTAVEDASNSNTSFGLPIVNKVK
jgi:hypothetical protein